MAALLEGIMAPQERSLLVEGKNIQLFEGGEGPPLLYLHGAGTFWWMPVHDLLARSFYVLSLSIPALATPRVEKRWK